MNEKEKGPSAFDPVGKAKAEPPGGAAWLSDPAARLERKNAFDASLVMGTSRFNQDTGRLTVKSRPFLWAVDPETGLVRSDLVRARRCPVCDEPPEKGLFIKDGFRHVKCAGCGLIYVSLILREDVLDRYWREELAWTGVLNSGPQMELDRRKYLYGLELAEARLGGRRLLDIGSGPGGFVKVAEERGWESSALEFNQESSRKLAEAGFKVIVKNLELSDLPDQSFDLISLWEVLEHLPEPRATLAEARRLLAPGGLILILVPNARSLVTRLLHEKSNTFGGHSHLNHFHPASLRRLLESLGLAIVEMETVITELGSINNHLDFEDPYNGRAEAFCPELSPELIHENLWGSRILTLAAWK
ncbi:MAG: class I SAM-dependent methyltransferase [Candidatus Adiutrix sp.]|jgi:SAM-dependent methyltransferase|nr:class I SAM-dependent methyltransferase [Candidatus Adiutrix sp.]